MPGSASMLITEDRHVVIVGRKHRSKWYEITCTCPKSRRRKDGTCKHQHQTFKILKPEIRARAKLKPGPMRESCR